MMTQHFLQHLIQANDNILVRVGISLSQEIRNTVGNIPLEWYNDYPHFGYDIEGKPLPNPVTGDEVGVVYKIISISVMVALPSGLYHSLCDFLFLLHFDCPILQLDEFVAKMDDPNYWRTIQDKVTGKEVLLSDDQIGIVQNLQKSRFPVATTDPYEVHTCMNIWVIVI